jgi:hypothetical protein
LKDFEEECKPPSQDKQPELEPPREPKQFKDIHIEKFDNYFDIAKEINDCLVDLKIRNPLAMKLPMIEWLKEQLAKGLELRKVAYEERPPGVLSRYIDDFGDIQNSVYSLGHHAKPKELDYKLIFCWQILVAFAQVPKNVFDKPFPDYFDPYYSVIEALTEGCGSLEAYQLKLFSFISQGKEKEIVHLRMVKVFVHMVFLENNIPY